MFYPLFDYNNVPANPLLAILDILGIKHNATITDIIAKTQEHLLRKKNQERWDVNPDLYEDKRTLLLPHLQTLGFVDAIQPQSLSYDYALIFGFVSIDVGSHLHYLTKFLPHLQIKQCVLLTSSLPLPDCVPARMHGITEADAMRQVYTTSALAQYPYTVIDVAMIPTADGIRRPTTDDTVLAWRATQPTPGTCLAVSGQPFIRRQTAILESRLPKTFTILSSGPTAEPTFSMSLYLDELARAVYQEQLAHQR